MGPLLPDHTVGVATTGPKNGASMWTISAACLKPRPACMRERVGIAPVPRRLRIRCAVGHSAVRFEWGVGCPPCLAVCARRRGAESLGNAPASEMSDTLDRAEVAAAEDGRTPVTRCGLSQAAAATQARAPVSGRMETARANARRSGTLRGPGWWQWRWIRGA